jgi:membrane-associated phospholipid phosphatase
MSTTGGIATGPDSARLRQLRTNVADTFATLFRRPAPTAFRPAWPPRSRLVLGAIAAIAVVAAAMVLLDGRLIDEARRLPPWIIRAFNEITDFGKSGWFLFPIGFLLIGIAAVATTELPRFTRLVLAAITVRLGFVFLAIAVPGLFVAILKRIIGRARPLVGEDNFVYLPFVWRNDYASIPSGHGTTGFAAAVAIGALWPRARPYMWAYAVLIAVSRVVVTAHFPSDVIAAVFFGVIGALLVRNWFAVRRLGFVVTPEGAVRTLPGPSLRRLKDVARKLFAQ